VLLPDGGMPVVVDQAETEMLVARREEAQDLAKHVQREITPAESALFPARDKNYRMISLSC
jgi:hypothetical protein